MYRILYLPNSKYRCYTVRKRTKRITKGRRIFAKCTTKEKATRQLRLLRAILYNPNFRRKSRLRRSTRKRKQTQFFKP